MTAGRPRFISLCMEAKSNLGKYLVEDQTIADEQDKPHPIRVVPQILSWGL